MSELHKIRALCKQWKVDTSPQISGLTGAQMEPTPIPNEDVCDEDDRLAAGDAPSVELSSEVSTHVGQVEELDI
jgi:hypothetical protein